MLLSVTLGLALNGCGGPQAAAPPVPTASSLLGVHEDLGYDGDTVHRHLVVNTAASVLHAQVSRSSFLWSDIETHQGQRDWSRYDDIAATVRAAGMVPLFVMVGSPSWANGVSVTTPRHDVYVPQGSAFDNWVGDYAGFASEAAARYRGTVSWELWNEPNSSVFWKPVPDASDYARWYSAVRNAMLAADPGARVAAGGLNHLVVAPIGEVSGVDFLDALSHASVEPSIIAIHPYTTGARGPLDHQPAGDNFDDVAAIHDWAAAHDPGAVIWITEMGWDSSVVGEAAQASDLDQALSMIRTAYGYVTLVVVFLDYDRPQYRFGLLDGSLVPKPAAHVFSRRTAPSPTVTST